MLAKALVGLLAVAAVAVGGYYYYDSISNPNQVGDNSPCTACTAETEAPPACCSGVSRETLTAGPCCEGASTGSETLTVAPRAVEVEAAPQPREASVQ